MGWNFLSIAKLQRFNRWILSRSILVKWATGEHKPATHFQTSFFAQKTYKRLPIWIMYIAWTHLVKTEAITLGYRSFILLQMHISDAHVANNI